MHKFILLLLACCLIAGCIQSGGGEQAKPLPVTPGSGSPVIYEYTPEVEKQSYRPGEQVVVHWKATQAPVTNATVVPTVILEAFLYGPFASKEEASKVTGKDKGGTIKASAQVITVDATNPNPPADPPRTARSRSALDCGTTPSAPGVPAGSASPGRAHPPYPG